MRTLFEKYLIDQGFIPDSDKEYYSSVDHIQTIYKKDGIEFYFGLSEKGKPPTLIYPRPNLKCNSFVDDNDINRLLMKYDSETIFKACLDKNVRLVL